MPVTAYKDVRYARFTITGPVEVEILAKDGPVKTARAQPAAHAPGAYIDGATVRFPVPRPMALVVQLDFREKLFLFGDPPADPVPSGADIGLRPNDGVVSEGVGFEP